MDGSMLSANKALLEVRAGAKAGRQASRGAQFNLNLWNLASGCNSFPTLPAGRPRFQPAALFTGRAVAVVGRIPAINDAFVQGIVGRVKQGDLLSGPRTAWALDPSPLAMPNWATWMLDGPNHHTPRSGQRSSLTQCKSNLAS
ncbi:hypothetical protein SKAU_G00339040 [Synaphobranchus kaupii]|uniref:Uncharacterized protein n=1 Tax=Synaphobranchus kaupii TaxID=118154 RepID=A0A9Q1EMP2_SYNKA|nr:hypothetical protein SKAU_G00339040 [Synaphobranchus kaupii]